MSRATISIKLLDGLSKRYVAAEIKDFVRVANKVYGGVERVEIRFFKRPRKNGRRRIVGRGGLSGWTGSWTLTSTWGKSVAVVSTEGHDGEMSRDYLACVCRWVVARLNDYKGALDYENRTPWDGLPFTDKGEQPEPKKSRLEKMGEVVQTRAAQAEAKLHRLEVRKAMLEKKLIQTRKAIVKERQRVAYYEKAKQKSVEQIEFRKRLQQKAQSLEQGA